MFIQMILCALTSSKYKRLLLLDHTSLGKILLCQRSYIKFLCSLNCINSHRHYKRENNLRIVFRLLREFAGVSVELCMSWTLMVIIRLNAKRGETNQCIIVQIRVIKLICSLPSLYYPCWWLVILSILWGQNLWKELDLMTRVSR